VPDLPVLEKYPQLALSRPAIIADHAQTPRAPPRQPLNQIIRKSRAAESAEHDRSSVGDIRHRKVHRRKNSIFSIHI
jgi:hypothetical protein